MSVERRGFLKMAGCAAVGLAGASALPAGTSREAGHSTESVGDRWAMVVDLTACLEDEGCTDCSDACHRIHNVPQLPDPREEVKWIWKERFVEAFPTQEHEYLRENVREGHHLVFCNHCDEPPCTRVCPTKATWRREDGVVMMDWHRCIGCRYCIAACPYGSRSFNWRDPRPHIAKQDPGFPTRTRGVVEKCTFCDERLARGQAPACVDACQEKALTFGNLGDKGSEVRRLLEQRHSIRRKPALGTRPSVFYLV